MLSSTAAYALRAVLYVARNEAGGPVRVGDAAQALGLPSASPTAVLREQILKALNG